jgi:hypothetical protein
MVLIIWPLSKVFHIVPLGFFDDKQKNLHGYGMHELVAHEQ